MSRRLASSPQAHSPFFQFFYGGCSQLDQDFCWQVKDWSYEIPWLKLLLQELFNTSYKSTMFDDWDKVAISFQGFAKPETCLSVVASGEKHTVSISTVPSTEVMRVYKVLRCPASVMPIGSKLVLASFVPREIMGNRSFQAYEAYGIWSWASIWFRWSSTSWTHFHVKKEVAGRWGFSYPPWN